MISAIDKNEQCPDNAHLGMLGITATFASLFRKQNYESIVFTYEIYRSLADSTKKKSFLLLARHPNAWPGLYLLIFVAISQEYCSHGPLPLSM